MVVGPVELRRAGTAPSASETGLVAHVHAQRDLRLLAVAAERRSPISRPTTTPRSNRVSSRQAPQVFHREKNVKRRLRHVALSQRRDDEVAIGLVALAVRLDVVAVAQVLVHEPALDAVIASSATGRPLCSASSAASSACRSQRLGAALAVALGVDDDPRSRRVGRRDSTTRWARCCTASIVWPWRPMNSPRSSPSTRRRERRSSSSSTTRPSASRPSASTTCSSSSADALGRVALIAAVPSASSSCAAAAAAAPLASLRSAAVAAAPRPRRVPPSRLRRLSRNGAGRSRPPRPLGRRRGRLRAGRPAAHRHRACGRSAAGRPSRGSS